MFGWSATDIAGNGITTLFPAELGDVPAGLQVWSSCRFRGSARHRDGARLALAVRFEPLAAPDVGLGVVFCELEADSDFDAREVEARYESVVGAMHEGVLVFGLDGAIRSCNPAAVRILGHSEAELLGRSLDSRWHAVHEDGAPWSPDTYPAVVTLRTGAPQSGVVMGIHRPDGALAWVSINSEPIRLCPHARPHAVVATFVDITEARLAAERVKRLAGLLPVCAWCKSVRNDRGYWQQIEHYLAEHTDARFTHGLCPSCSAKLPPS